MSMSITITHIKFMEKNLNTEYILNLWEMISTSSLYNALLFKDDKSYHVYIILINLLLTYI